MWYVFLLKFNLNEEVFRNLWFLTSNKLDWIKVSQTGFSTLSRQKKKPLPPSELHLSFSGAVHNEKVTTAPSEPTVRSP
ncbi:hypothetical protein PsorP6_001641 [Peronosclerospora sorghi]|uniref:Uncharacterized protein n=1 Tax=Peronosclerospora sorghi TaxID=230839 RepID=A0ACC0WUY5_9STRA|nr:hypothetical protein PsorP6_001641 [Peronosclerospora sorghi]